MGLCMQAMVANQSEKQAIISKVHLNVQNLNSKKVLENKA